MAAQPDVTIRRVRPSDSAALARFYAELSPASRRARFLSACAGVSERQSRGFCTPDHFHAEGYVAVAPGRPDGAVPERLVGHLCLEPADDRRIELALAVADDSQRQGIGRRLFQAALAWAQQRGMTEIVACAYAHNGAVLRLLTSAPFPAVVSAADGGVVDVVIPLRAPLPSVWRDLSGAAGAPRRIRRGPSRGRAPTRRPCRVVWRQTRPPARGAVG